MHVRTTLLSLLLVCWPINRLSSQDRSAAESTAFEVASIKPIDTGVSHMVGVTVHPGGRVVISALPLKTLIAIAFRLSYWQISGGDAWTENDRYDLEAKPPEKSRSGIKDLRYTLYEIEDEHLREMLQALLIDRFQLRFHRETKTGDIYLLERNGKALRLRPSDAASADTSLSTGTNLFGSIGFAGGRWVLNNTAMAQLAKFAAENVLRSPVVDRTELSGSFDYRQPTSLPQSEANYSDPSDSFLRLIPELGLKLERGKGPIEIFVIDHATKPSPN